MNLCKLYKYKKLTFYSIYIFNVIYIDINILDIGISIFIQYRYYRYLMIFFLSYTGKSDRGWSASATHLLIGFFFNFYILLKIAVEIGCNRNWSCQKVKCATLRLCAVNQTACSLDYIADRTSVHRPLMCAIKNSLNTGAAHYHEPIFQICR